MEVTLKQQEPPMIRRPWTMVLPEDCHQWLAAEKRRTGDAKSEIVKRLVREAIKSERGDLAQRTNGL